MKKLYSFLLLSVASALLTLSAHAITVDTVSITGPATLKLNTCDTNIFHVTFIDHYSGSHVLMIHDSIGNLAYNSCHGNGGNDLSILQIFNPMPSGLLFYHNLTSHT